MRILYPRVRKSSGKRGVTSQGRGEQIATSLGVLGLQHQDEMSNLVEQFAWTIVLCLSPAMLYSMHFSRYLLELCVLHGIFYYSSREMKMKTSYKQAVDMILQLILCQHMIITRNNIEMNP